MKNLWILHKASGLCIYNQKFQAEENIDVDADLFGGFVSALLSFAQEVSGGQASLEEIAIGPVKIVYDNAENVIVSIAFNRHASETDIRDLMKRITDRFLERFANSLPPDKFDNNITPYKAFVEDIAEIYQPTSLIEGEKPKIEGRHSVIVEEDYGALNTAVRNFLAGDHQASFEVLEGTLKGSQEEGEQGRGRIQNTLEMVQKFANKLGIDTDFEPLFEKIRTNTIGEIEDDYGPFQ